MTIRAVLFDMDGTIYDSGIDWLEVRRRIGISKRDRPILAQLGDVEPDARERGLSILHRAERDGAENGSLVSGARDLLGLLHEHEVRCALITNNSRRSTEIVLRRHPLVFDLVLTRDDGASKPDPDLFCIALDRLGVAAEESLVVGDAHLDVIAAHRAGIREVILVGAPEWMKDQIPPEASHRVADDLYHVREIVEGFLSGAVPDGPSVSSSRSCLAPYP